MKKKKGIYVTCLGFVKEKVSAYLIESLKGVDSLIM
jgi:hypothetical protein